MTLCEQIKPEPIPIPEGLKQAFAPATCCLWEWQDYWLELPEAAQLQVGQKPQNPVGNTHVFRLRFENQLGRANIRALDKTGRPTESVTVEVVSPKTTPSPDEAGLNAHLSFYRQLLDDLYQRAAQLPFTINAPTGRGVVEALRPPTPLFTYHFLCQYAKEIQEALNIVLADPHRLLSERTERVPLFQASEADPDVLLEILRNPSEWIPAHSPPLSAIPLATMLHGNLPQRVWQRLPEETFDSAENRFVLAFLEQLLVAAECLPSQPWWKNAPEERITTMTELTGLLRQTIYHPMFAEVGSMAHLPFNSQVLLRREGYRDLLNLWQQFHLARRPLFEPLQQAIDLRDIAMLYEIWVFFALVQEIACALGEQPTLELKLSDEHGLDWSSLARFGPHRLVYNRIFPHGSSPFHSYSRPMRPDFVWIRNDQPAAIFDAKFRLAWEQCMNEEDNCQEAASVLDDLYKMHTYRDALDVPAVVSLYPGSQKMFYDRRRGRLKDIGIADLLFSELSGVGAIPLAPRGANNDK